MMKEDGVKARFVRGGSTKYLVELLQEGLTDYILDGQTFDLDAVKIDCQRSPARGDLAVYFLQLSRQGIVRVDDRRSGAGRDRG